LTLSLPKKIAFAAITMGLVFFVCVAALLGFDIYLHHRVQYAAGVNVWGYRGDVVGKKKPGETRIVALGGSTAFGYGLPWNESWPYYLEQKINAHRAGRTPVSVVNLGVPTDSARSFVATLGDYEYLNYDIVCLYEGYNDLGQDDHSFKGLTNPDVPHYIAWRYQSPIFRWTGYFPIFPLVLNEKAMSMTHGGDLESAYGRDKIVFKPNLATRATAATLQAASQIGVEIEKKFGELSNVKAQLTDASDASCGKWRQYCGAVAEAVDRVIARNKRVLVITQPYLSDLHVDQQTALAGLVRRRYGSDPRVRYVNLGRAVNIQDKSLVYDGIHLVARGNAVIAEALAPVLLEMVH
jgi:lysophospholipase L1-like esterase